MKLTSGVGKFHGDCGLGRTFGTTASKSRQYRIEYTALIRELQADIKGGMGDFDLKEALINTLYWGERCG